MAPNKLRNERQVAELVLQLGRTAYADCASGGLTQAQWMALRFFARANRFSRSISAYADFHATTRGTASQTVKSLVNQGYLTRQRSDRDGRSSRFDLTEQACRKMADDPLDGVVRAARRLSPEQCAGTVDGLRQMLRCLVEEKGRPGVGVCALCGHLGKGEDTAYQCKLMREPLETRETEELCVRFSPRSETA
jgi:DNA-binding MarR family transcriptional regulator